MRQTLPRLIGVVLLVFLGVQPVLAQSSPEDGSQLVAQAAAQMGTYEALQCRVRQRVQMFGRELNGHGRYQQARIGTQLRLRMEMKLPIGDQATHLQQINDGDFLWTRRAILDDQQLTVIDVRRVRAEWAQEPDRLHRAIAIGGIAELLYGIHEAFEFDKPRPGKLGNEPVWILNGAWKAKDKKEKAEQGRRPQIPTAVLVVLSRDELLPLFPFRIEYYRDVSVETGVRRDTLMTLEFFEVGMLQKVDVRHFTYSAGAQEIEDVTDEYLERH